MPLRLSDIDLRLLRVFKAVAEAGGFVRAQDELGISQPAISSHIANLEQRLNVRLCERGRRGFSLTPYGQEVLGETNQLLAHLDSYADRLVEIGRRPRQRLRIGVVDCLLTDRNNPLPAVIGSAAAEFDDMRTRIGVYDYLDCLTELRAGRLDIAVAGIAQDERMPDDFETLHLYDEWSGLYCSPAHDCAGIADPDALFAALKTAKISAHSFLSNPLDDSLDLYLLDENAEISQGNIESTTYLTLAGTHVGLIPNHYAAGWVASGNLVALAPETYGILSSIHAMRLASAEQNEVANRIWDRLSSP